MKGSIGASTILVKGNKKETIFKSLTNKIKRLKKQYKKTPSKQLMTRIFELKCKKMDLKYY